MAVILVIHTEHNEINEECFVRQRRGACFTSCESRRSGVGGAVAIYIYIYIIAKHTHIQHA